MTTSGSGHFLGLHIATVWLAILGTIVSATLFYLSRVHNWFTVTTIFVYIAATILILGVMHFYYGASAGPPFAFLQPAIRKKW